jgi:hypothetical protein
MISVMFGKNQELFVKIKSADLFDKHPSAVSAASADFPSISPSASMVTDIRQAKG